MTDPPPEPDVPLAEQVGLILRACRRARGQSQRAFARSVGVTQSSLARLERSAERCSLGTVVDLLAETGHTLGIVDADGALVTEWDRTDLEARDRTGRRFPAHRKVSAVAPGSMRPLWWMLAEYFAGGEQPAWTAEGFPIPEGSRFGREPRPYDPDEGPRFPDGEPHLP